MNGRQLRAQRRAVVEQKREVYLEEGEDQPDLPPEAWTDEGLPIRPEDWPLPTNSGIVDFDPRETGL
jgi:hypothetical protein